MNFFSEKIALGATSNEHLLEWVPNLKGQKIKCACIHQSSNTNKQKK